MTTWLTPFSCSQHKARGHARWRLQAITTVSATSSGSARAHDHAGKDITPETVGAEPEFRRWRLQRYTRSRFIEPVPIGHDIWRKDGDQAPQDMIQNPSPPNVRKNFLSIIIAVAAFIAFPPREDTSQACTTIWPGC